MFDHILNSLITGNNLLVGRKSTDKPIYSH